MTSRQADERTFDALALIDLGTSDEEIAWILGIPQQVAETIRNEFQDATEGDENE